MTKHHTSLRLAPHTRQQLLALAARLGMSQAEIVGVALERLAREKYEAALPSLWKDEDALGSAHLSFEQWIAASQPDDD